MSHSRVNYRGVGIYAFPGGKFDAGKDNPLAEGNGKQLEGLTSFGTSGTFSSETESQIGYDGIVGIAEDSMEATATIEARERGSIHNIKTLLGLDGKQIDLFKDIGKNRVDVVNFIMPNEGNDEGKVLFAQMFKNAYVTSYSGNYVNEGESTETIGIATDDYGWVKYDGEQPTSVEVPFGAPSSGIGGIRRGHLELVIVTNTDGIASTGSFLTNTSGTKALQVASFSFDANVDSSSITEIGSWHAVDRLINHPLDVSVSFDVTFKDLSLMGLFFNFDSVPGAGSASNNLYRIENFKKNVGVVLKIYDDKDTNSGRGLLKEIHIPYLIPTDDAFNVSLDGNATMTYTFRTHHLGIVDKTT